ncbi:poly(U)-specific endoribonuclease-A-like [Polyodon spathula]|uniref:poly(U)-specific endoribonuclease-A-like n=1 Tax=Polyodon spathula TaxID=7913 RepID=UPI001B7D981A|nr:poly(U)-specific endoribonuclease-A-like [Polyodon spathula]
MAGRQINHELSEILTRLWAADENRLKSGKDYVICPQRKAVCVAPGSSNARDEASAPLFTYVNEERLKSIKTYACKSFPFEIITQADSCGFEHVLVGETRSKQVIGFHNWIQFYLQEKQNHLNYRGNKARSNKHRPEEDQLLTFQFSCKDQLKPVRSSFIGVSPEFEFAVYTICFLMSHTHSVVKVDEYELELVVYRHGGCIGSSYPKLLSSNNTM